MQSAQVVYDQADFFMVDGFTRQTGLTPNDVTAQIYFNNTQLPWVLESGVGTLDAQVTAGKIYWQEIPGPGPYSVRWRPNAVGYWRLVISYPLGAQMVAQDYDVLPGTGAAVGGGMKASFIGPGDRNEC